MSDRHVVPPSVVMKASPPLEKVMMLGLFFSSVNVTVSPP
jgi:hypothetical protein